jgi:hypothetical protein
MSSTISPIYPNVSKAAVVYCDSLKNSTVPFSSLTNALIQYVPRRSPHKTQHDSPFREMDIVKFSCDVGGGGGEVDRFFQRSYVSPPRKSSMKMDPRIGNVLKQAE